MSKAVFFIEFRRRAALLIAFSLLFQLIQVMPNQIADNLISPASATSTCSSSQFSISAKQNTVFYFDSGATPSITSGYTAYEITAGSTGSFWAKLNSATFAGGGLGIATYEDPVRPLGNLNSGDKKTVFWLLTASTATATAQTFNIDFYDSDPAVGSPTAVCTLTGGFSGGTAETIAASANKLVSVNYTALGTAGSSTFVATVKGKTGTIGQGPTGTYDVNLNPVTKSNFAAGNFRLVNTSYKCGTGTARTGTLYLSSACSGDYTAEFTYEYLADISSAPAGSSKNVSPILQIASGTQMKHTTTPSFTIANIGSPSVTTTKASYVSATSWDLNGVINTGTFTNTFFCYSASSGSSFDGATCANKVPNPLSGNPLTYSLTSLSPGVTYYYEFIGYISSGSGTYYNGGVLSFNTVAAKTVTFDPNGGVLASGSATETYNATPGEDAFSYTPDLDPSRTGYGFLGWNTNKDAVNTVLTTLTVGSSNIDLFAIWQPNKYKYNKNTGTGSAMSDQTYAGVDLLASTNTYGAPSGYEFGGWCTTQPAAGSECTGTKYLEGVVLPAPASSEVILYAIWKTPTPAAPPPPVYVPHPPTITSISVPEVCAVSSQLVIKGTWLTGATVKVEDLAARVLSSSYNQLLVELPSAPVGTRTITVKNIDGTATTTIKYTFADTPIFVNYVYPETFKDRAFTYTFKATDAAKYEISGVMPAGLTLDPLTGELSGTPTQTGDYVFQIIASNICASTPLIVYMFVDKAIPDAFTCSVAFNVPTSNNITEQKLINLRNCLSKTTTLSPKYIDPVIFISGGIPSGLTPEQALTHPRYLPILDLIQSMNLNAQIYLGAFSGSLDSVQLNVYWPEPSE